MKNILLLIFILYSTFNQAQTNEGTIGEHSIFLALDVTHKELQQRLNVLTEDTYYT